MNENDIIKMCQRLAKKYKDPQEYDDLVSEGFIKCLELIKSGVNDVRILHNSAAIQMNEYYNIRKNIVYVPVQGKAKGLSMENDFIRWNDLAMLNALKSETVELDESISTTPSVEIEYERKEWFRYLKSKMVEVLDEDELKIIDMRYFSNMTQDDVANKIGKHQKWVSRREIKALKKIRDSL